MHTRVRVDNVGVHIVGDLQIDAERLQRAVCFLEFLGNVVSDDLERTFRIVTRDFGNLILGTWSVKRTDRHIHAFRQNFGSSSACTPAPPYTLGGYSRERMSTFISVLSSSSQAVVPSLL